MTSRRLATGAALAGVAALSLLLPFAPVYDPWGWLVWGREIAGFDLDTDAGPSWKPLPVIATTVFAAFGDAAPDLWLFLARLGWLACPVLAALLAYRLSDRLPRRLALAVAALAALSVVLTRDTFTSWTRQFSGGLSEPLLVAFVLAAVERRLAGRDGQALALGTGAALLRPEAWPFLALYAGWLWREQRLPRAALLGSLAAVPLLWVVPDLIGSGDPLTGAERARGATGAPIGEAVESLGRSLDLVLWSLWATAAYAVAVAGRRGERTIIVIAALAAAWIAVVAVMAAAGYAGLPRFAAPAGALACVLGALGLGELADEVGRARRLAGRLRAVGLGILIRGRRYRNALAAAAALGVALVGLAVQGGIRAAEIPGEVESAERFGRAVDDLDRLVDAAGKDALAGCGEIATADLLTQTALAWELDASLGEVGVRLRSLPEPGAIVVAAAGELRVNRLAEAKGEPIAANRSWAAYAVSCAASSATGERIAGVRGTTR